MAQGEACARQVGKSSGSHLTCVLFSSPFAFSKPPVCRVTHCAHVGSWELLTETRRATTDHTPMVTSRR